MANALLVVDVQNFYLKDTPADLPRNIANHITALNYDVLAFSAFKNDESSNFVQSLKWDKCSSDEDAALPLELNTYVKTDNLFIRNTYSAFKTPGLLEYLRKNKVERLVICGVDTDACVMATAYEAFDLGFHVKVGTSLTYSSAGLQTEAEAILKRNVESRD